jgi:DNA end-binding protein Ku
MKALKEKGLTGVAKIAIRNKEQLCALRSKDGTLVLETLYYPDEIRAEPEKVPEADVSKKELDMAFALIDLLQEEFDPEKYNDEYRQALMEVIDAKLENREVEGETPARPAKVTDIMSALKKSVEAAKKKKAAEEEDEEEAAPQRRRKKSAA